MKKVAVILSGCGQMDGSEITESIVTLLALDRAEAKVQCFAPDISQTKVVNHLTGETTSEKRNVLQEAARIARGKVKDIKTANPADFDAAIFPGGAGAASNLCDFATQGSSSKIQADVLKFAKDMAQQHKPMGFICIAPAMIPLIYGKNVQMTIGSDIETANVLSAMGAKHISCSVLDYVVDKQHKVVSTPAYMLGKSISEVAVGIERLVDQVLDLA